MNRHKQGSYAYTGIMQTTDGGVSRGLAKPHVAPVSRGASVSPHLLSVTLLVLLGLTVADVIIGTAIFMELPTTVLLLASTAIKIGLVLCFFMHVVWEKTMYAVVFGITLMLGTLLVIASVADRREYKWGMNLLHGEVLAQVSQPS